MSDESLQLAVASGRTFPEGAPVPGASRTQVAVLPEPRARSVQTREVVAATPAQPSQIPTSSGYFVQAGAFTSYGNARRLVAELGRLGAASVSEAPVGDVTFYRVRLGPYANAGDASRVLSEVLAAGYSDARLVQN